MDLMWQEDFAHPLCRALSWQACHLRLSELLSTQEVDKETEATAADEEEVMFCLRLLRPSCTGIVIGGGTYPGD